MQLAHDAALRSTARAIYDTVYPTDDRVPFDFDDAERYGTIHYRQAVDAAIEARAALATPQDRQPTML